MSLEHLYAKNLAKELFKQKESLILEQLNELLSRGLLVIEESEPILVQDYNTDKIRLSQSVRLVVKEQEYIRDLEKENKELKAKLESISAALNDEGI